MDEITAACAAGALCVHWATLATWTCYSFALGLCAAHTAIIRYDAPDSGYPMNAMTWVGVGAAVAGLAVSAVFAP